MDPEERALQDLADATLNDWLVEGTVQTKG
jgi:hypothetical protein